MHGDNLILRYNWCQRFIWCKTMHDSFIYNTINSKKEDNASEFFAFEASWVNLEIFCGV